MLTTSREEAHPLKTNPARLAGPRRRGDATRWLTLLVALALYLLSCALIVGQDRDGAPWENGAQVRGIGMLLFGWTTVTDAPHFTLAWMANIPWLLAFIWLWLRGFAAAALCAAAAVAYGLVPLVWVICACHPHLRLESPMALVYLDGRMELRVGYVVWLASHATLLAGTSGLWYRASRGNRRNRTRGTGHAHPGGVPPL